MLWAAWSYSEAGHNSVMQMEISPSTSGLGNMTANPLGLNFSRTSGLQQQLQYPLNRTPPQYSNVTIKSEPLNVKQEPMDFGDKIIGIGNINNNNNNNKNINNCNGLVKYEMDDSPGSKVADQKPNICAGCNFRIVEQFLLKADDKVWHENCLRCQECGCPLNTHKSLFLKNNRIYCKKDYTRLFVCSVCHKAIPATDMVMRAGGNVYHLECFACQECNHRFCVGDKFYFDFDNNKILCDYHYNERNVFASFSHCNSPLYLAQLKRQFNCQIEDLDEMMTPMPR